MKKNVSKISLKTDQIVVLSKSQAQHILGARATDKGNTVKSSCCP
ncbi:class I lanthipeptide [Spirosoma sp. BT702]|uniref:Class I lanthipeptide n=1 Tax=Spirosoma profusum TaxID=2771354 RepID=A0A927AT84_9BACT|nr:class I lanthipeptide [Spirosoma profusum]